MPLKLGVKCHWKRQLDRPAGIVGLQKVEKEVWYLSALGAALP